MATRLETVSFTLGRWVRCEGLLGTEARWRTRGAEEMRPAPPPWPQTAETNNGDRAAAEPLWALGGQVVSDSSGALVCSCREEHGVGPAEGNQLTKLLCTCPLTGRAQMGWAPEAWRQDTVDLPCCASPTGGGCLPGLPLPNKRFSRDRPEVGGEVSETIGRMHWKTPAAGEAGWEAG
ncbi:hypothetical protein NDU88_002605 [Pleurodeles waltl]|uniref:Uncharacterized protein n=1 Tax=Pleurodeles waltl TaxID=8319 RepID=A0AAV7QAE0_PLEWA|nr:hypothetical protein NDU88_002605 [Pleurodeles waltl]